MSYNRYFPYQKERETKTRQYFIDRAARFDAVLSEDELDRRTKKRMKSDRIFDENCIVRSGKTLDEDALQGHVAMTEQTLRLIETLPVEEPRLVSLKTWNLDFMEAIFQEKGIPFDSMSLDAMMEASEPGKNRYGYYMPDWEALAKNKEERLRDVIPMLSEKLKDKESDVLVRLPFPKEECIACMDALDDDPVYGAWNLASGDDEWQERAEKYPIDEYFEYPPEELAWHKKRLQEMWDAL